MKDGLDLSRRDFIKASSVMPLSLMSGSAMADQLSQEPHNVVKPVAWLLGAVDRSPNDIPALEPGGEFFETSNRELELYAYIYQQPNGTQWYITEQHSEWKQIRMNPQTQLEEVRTENYQSFFDHTFARPEAPDMKNWMFDPADVTLFESEVELGSTATLVSIQEGNYPPGTEAVAGGAWRVTGTPTAGEARLGYYNDDNGFGVGEDATDSFIFVRKNGSEFKVYRGNWSEHNPDSRVWVTDYPHIVRFPHLFYGGGAIEFRNVFHYNGKTELRTLHRVTPENTPDTWGEGPPFDQPNLPIQFESSGLVGGALRANAAHYEIGETDNEKRINGEHFDGVSAGTGDWVPLMMWRKRSGWDMVNVKPAKIAVSAELNDAKLEIQVNPDISGQTWDLPTHSSSSETAVEVTRDGNQGSIVTDGERRWVGYDVAGTGNAGGAAVIADLDFNLPADQVVVLAAQGVGGNANLSGSVAWEEYF